MRKVVTKAVLLTAGLGAGLAAAVFLSMSLAGAEEPTTLNGGGGLEGQALIDDLGLPRVDGQDASCHAKFDFGDVIYCLDPAAGTDAEAVALADRIRGVAVPSEADVQIAQAEADLAEASEAVQHAFNEGDNEALAEANAEFARLSAQLAELQAFLETGTG
jgi:hypothetical protein